MAFTLDNFVRSILAVDAAVGDTSLVLSLAAPPLRDPPVPSAGAPGILILQDQPTSPTKIEIVTYTGVSINGTQATLTGVTRGLEGTSPQAWTAGTQTFSGSTAAVLAQFALKAALAAVATSGSYNDLTNKPTTWAWSAITGKPTFAAVATSGAYSDLTGTPALGTAAAQDSTAFATAAQGATADNAMPKAGGAFTGNISAPNLSGTNTGDQDLSGYLQQATTGWGGSGLPDITDYNTLGLGTVYAHNGGLNVPLPGTDWFNTLTYGVSNRITQFASQAYNGGDRCRTFIRNKHDSTWGAWVEVWTSGNQPHIFVQSTDPGAAAADGDLWFW